MGIKGLLEYWGKGFILTLFLTTPHPTRSARFPSPSQERGLGRIIYMSDNSKLLYIARILRKKMTKAEKMLWEELRDEKLGYKFRRQQPMVLGVYNFIVDFYCPEKKLIIEADGGIHNKEEIKEIDKFREDILKSAGYKIIRFKNNEVENNIEDVLEQIKQALANSPSPD